MSITGRKAMLRRIKYDIRSSQIPLVILTIRADIYSKLSGIGEDAEAYLVLPSEKIRLKAVLKNLTRLECKYQELGAPCILPEINDCPESDHDNPLMQMILSHLDANIDDDQFGISELCVSLGISRAQIYRKFKSLTDTKLHDYMRSYRLKKAKELLLSTELNVSEVAYRTGFKNVSHFSRIFSAEFGKSPSEFGR